jgi:hypothetical protein
MALVSDESSSSSEEEVDESDSLTPCGVLLSCTRFASAKLLSCRVAFAAFRALLP